MNSQQLYVEKLGLVCPNCGSPHINSEDGIDADGGCAWQNVYCEDCDARWQDVYTLTGYDNLVVPNGKNVYLIEFLADKDAFHETRKYNGNNPEQAIIKLKKHFPLAIIQNVALIVDWK